jgi:phospholipid-translocating ATPase
MVFRKCCIGGKSYHGDPSMEEEGLAEKGVESLKPLPDIIDPSKAKDIPLADVSTTSAGSSTQPEKPKVSGESDVPDPLDATKSKARVHFHDVELSKDLQDSMSAEPTSAEAAHARLLNGFFSVLALCHTVLTSVDPVTGVIEYKAQSPDEAALVQAAADMGFVFRGRDREILMLQTPFSGASSPGVEKDVVSVSETTKKDSLDTTGTTAAPAEGLERYELLNILEFTSARKRMSVVVRKLDSDDNRLFLMTKGADNVIFERLKKGTGDELKKQTEKALDDFASEGLRTLTLAYKVVSGESLPEAFLWSRILTCSGRCRRLLPGLG